MSNLSGAFAVMRHGIRSWWKDRRSMLLGIAAPVLLFLLFAWIFSGTNGAGMPALKIGWVDMDNSKISGELRELLENGGVIRPVTSLRLPFEKKEVVIEESNVENLIRTGKLGMAIVILPGLENQVLYFRRWGSPFVRLLYDPTQATQANIVKGLLTRGGFLLMSQALTGDNRGSGAKTEKINPHLQKFAADLRKAFRESRLLMGEGKGSSIEESLLPISVQKVAPQERENFAAAQQMAGIAVMFLLFSVSRAGSVLLEEKQSGTLKRILSSPVPLNAFMAGKLLSVTFNGTMQIGVMALAGWLFFRVPVFRSPFAVLLITAATALCAAGFGLVFSTFCQTSEQVMATATFVILSMSLVGGSMVPSFLLPVWAQRLSVLTLNGWAMEGFLNVLSRGMGVFSIWPQLLALFIMTGFFLAITLLFLPGRLYE